MLSDNLAAEALQIYCISTRGQRDRFHRLASAVCFDNSHGKIDFAPGTGARQQTLRLLHGSHVVFADPINNQATLDAGAIRWTVGLDRADEHAFPRREPSASVKSGVRFCN